MESGMDTKRASVDKVQQLVNVKNFLVDGALEETEFPSVVYYLQEDQGIRTVLIMNMCYNFI